MLEVVHDMLRKMKQLPHEVLDMRAYLPFSAWQNEVLDMRAYLPFSAWQTGRV
jgi:hypothetical protein